MKHIFIINPNSGIGEYREVLAWIKDSETARTLDIEVYETQYVGHAKEIAAQYDDPEVILYSAGGDGTLHEILNGMSFNCSLCVLPVGTGNDFWRMMGFTGSVKEIIEASLEGETRRVDVGLVNGERFLNCANFGLDAAINKDVNESRKHFVPRKMLYMYYAVKNIFDMHPLRYEITMNGETKKVSSVLTSIMNGRWYGNGFKSTPNARFDDGLFDVCRVDPISISEAFQLLPKYMKGTHIHHPKVHISQVDKVTIKSNQDILYGLDGEIFTGNLLYFSILRHAVLLRVPKGAQL